MAKDAKACPLEVGEAREAREATGGMGAKVARARLRAPQSRPIVRRVWPRETQVW